jgi:phage repressor protein C with HTH and peptisase S24 domain
MALGDRILERLTLLKMSQADLARRVGITQPSINHLIKKGAGGSAHLHKIARELSTTPEYLTGEADSPDIPEGFEDRRSAFHGSEPQAGRTDIVEIEEIDVQLGLGGTYLDGPVKAVKVAFSRSWLRHFTDSAPEHLFSATGIGDSMHPTILDNDLVLVDRSDTTPKFGDKIFACAYGQVGMVKRLRPMPDGGIKILSDNQSVPPETAYDDELHIIGRVVAIVRKY